ncbi:MAG: hypothetical protein KAU62_13575 [Candidatus Heimdallarchaeota archaeon]|nr:hypothetical protein [Candidatus Heimdallarchaeota archaeon]MCG3257123.1 hypothetical protein [Candidatus Heimdallarchaeota archaeon]MCK4612183.1 hypothetical protein [Candidatus Heimdallarchaeota archaeon]
MKRGIGYIICVNLIITIFVGGLINVNPVNAYKPLKVGDQLLYSVDYNSYYDYESLVLYHTDLSPSYNSYWDTNYHEMTSVETHSYTINAMNPSDYDVRHTSKYQDTYRDDYWDHYYYDYISESWFFDYNGFSSDLYSGSNTFSEIISHFNPVLNLDIQYMFTSLTYSHTTSKTYIINGISNSYTVDVYTYGYADSYVSNSSYYEVYYDNYVDYSYDYTYYIDNVTGFLLEYEYVDDYQQWSNFIEQYSTTLVTNITRDYYYYSHIDMHYYLVQTTAGFTPVADADLPGLEWDWMYIYDITGYSDFVEVFFWLYDSTQVDLDIYRDGVYIETLFGLTAGYHSYKVYFDDIPPGYFVHELTIVATDTFDVDHKTEWSLWMFDTRLDWPQINGPFGDYWYEIGTTKTLYWTLTDDNYDSDFFEFKFDGMILDDGSWMDGKILGINLNDTIISPGDYIVHIYASDTMGHESYLDLTIHASYTAETTPPTVTSPADIYMKPGENKEIIWTISDDNPSSYLVTQNGSIITDLPWAIDNFNVNVSLSTLTLGTWVFEIEVKDSFGNINYDTVYVYVTEEGINPTEPTDTNTITLDAPGLIFAVIGFLSITALTVYVKKRK